MKHSAAVYCAAAVSRCRERCLEQVRVKSQSSFVFTGIATVLLTPCTQNTRKLKKHFQTSRKQGMQRRQRDEFRTYCPLTIRTGRGKSLQLLHNGCIGWLQLHQTRDLVLMVFQRIKETDHNLSILHIQTSSSVLRYFMTTLIC